MRTAVLGESCTQLNSARITLLFCFTYYSLVLWPGQVELPPADLGPTASLTQTLSLLREVLASHDSSVVPLDARQADFAQVDSYLHFMIRKGGKSCHILMISDNLLIFQGSVLLCVSQVLSCILDPLLQLCTVSASNLGTADMASYMVNSLYVMKTTLALFEFTDKRLEMLEFQVCLN